MPDVEVRALRIRVEVDEGSLNRSRELIENMVNNLQAKCKLSLSIDSKALASSTAGVMSTVTKVASESAAAVEKTTSTAFNEKKLKSFYLAQQKMQLQLNRMGSGASTKEFEQFNNLLNSVAANGGKGFEELASSAISARDSIRALNREMNDAADVEGLRTRLANKLSGGEWLSGQAARLQSSFVDADPALVQAATAKLNEIRELGDVAQMSESELNALNNALNQYNALMNAVGASNAANRSLREQATALANLKAQYQDYMLTYGQNLSKNIPLMEKFRTLGEMMQSGAISSGDAAQRFAELREEARSAGVEIQTVGQRMSGLFSTHFNTAIIMYALYGLRTLIRQLWKDIRELNDALVQTQIVTGLSGNALKAYTEDAYRAAERSKDTITNVLSSATAYGRLGYDSDLSVQLAELTSMYGKIGDVDTQEATDAITALMKAFNLEDASQIEDALDKMIYVGNNFPISAAGLGESLNNAASALASSGNTLEQSLAMLMVANETVQNPSKSSTAMRTMTARIRNSKAELDELGEEMEEKWNTVSKYRDSLLGVSGVDILDATGKEFRSTADILGDLAAVWQNLSSVERATVTTMIAGTRNQDIFASLMANWEDYEKAMAGMDDASGLMASKFEAVEQSISGAMSSLGNSFSRFSNNLLNSDAITGFIHSLQNLLDVLNGLMSVTGGSGFLALSGGIGLLISRFKQFSQEYALIGPSISRVNAFASVGDMSRVTAELSSLSQAQRSAVISGSQLTRAQRQYVAAAMSTSTATRTVSASMIEEAAASKALNLTESQQAAVKSGLGVATMGLNGIERQALVTKLNQLIVDKQLTAEQALMIASQLGVAAVITTTTTAAGQQVLQLQILGREYASLGAKTKSFLGSGNWIIMAVAAVIALFSSIKQANDAAAQAFVDSNEKMVEGVRTASQEYEASLSSYEQQLNSIGQYSDRIHEVDEQLKNATGPNEYLVAQSNLKTVVSELTEQFNLQASDVQQLTGDLQNYETTMDGILKKRRYEQITSGEGYQATQKMVNLYGYDLNGNKVNPNFMLSSGKWSVTMLSAGPYVATAGIQAGVNSNAANKRFERYQSNLTNLLTRGGTVDMLPGIYITHGNKVDKGATYNWGSNETQHPFEMDYAIKSVGASIDAVVPWLEDLVEYYKKKGDTKSAEQVSTILAQVIENTGYKRTNSAFDEWADLTILYGEPSSKLAVPYLGLQDAKTGFMDAVTSGDHASAADYLSQMFDFLEQGKAIAAEAGYDWAITYFDGIIDGVGNGNEDLLRALSKGYLDYGDAIDYDVKSKDFASTSQERILLAGQLNDREEALRAGLLEEYGLYQILIGAAEQYGTTIETILSWLSILYGLPVSDAPVATGGLNLSTFHNDKGSGLDVEDPFTNESVLGATESVSKVKSASDKLFDAEATRDRIKEAFDSGEEIAQEDIDAIKEYVGDTFDEINEDVLASIDETLDESRDEVSTSIEGLANSAIKWMEDNVEGFNLADYIDTDGNIDFSGIIAAFQNSGVEEAAGAAGANASMSYLSQLQTVGGATIRAKLDADGLGYTTEFSGGSAGGDGGGKRGGGGGGGKKSQISDDLENVERLIKLFSTLLNYYEEGSDQWIARQTQLIDKYKAGVEIAMNEYRRLKAKGLKETDDDVKKLVDTILEYQDSIYEESEKLWEAVRQNQIDSLQHLKDQNDAAIDLEETHHDLLIAIRDERRELEDELKAARDAYSEVMTPEELDAMFSVEDYAELMDKLATIEGDAMSMYRDYKEQIAAVSEDETYMIEHITDEFERQYELKMKEYEIAKAELGVARAQQELENVKNEQTVMMLIGGKWQWVADPEKVLEAEQKLADAEQELADAQDEFNFQSLINEMEAQSSGIQQQIDALEALTFSMDDLAEQIHLFSDSVYKELLTYLSQIAQSIFDKYEGDTAVPEFAEGGVIKRGGLAMVHSGEPIFSTADAEKLWRFVHDLGDTPVNTLGVYSGIANKLLDSGVDTLGGVSTVAVDNSINIPGGIHVHGEMAQQLITLLKEVVAPYQPNV